MDVETVWRQHGDNMGTTWGPRGCGPLRGNIVETTWGQHKDNVETTWGQHGDHWDVETTWGQHGDNMGITGMWRPTYGRSSTFSTLDGWWIKRAFRP